VGALDLARRRQRLDVLLAAARPLWQAQPFREPRPAWCAAHPALAAELLALDQATAEGLNNDGRAARAWLARRLPGGAWGDLLAEVDELVALPMATPAAESPVAPPSRWAWEIPGRKQAQIEAFARAARASGRPVIDWCGGKGHLGRLLGLTWAVPVDSLDIDPALCAAGQTLARRAGVVQGFRVADALGAGATVAGEHHLVALHACGDLHRTAIQAGARGRVSALDVAPCCYYRGVAERYQPLAPGTRLDLGRDDLRLAVTETVTASPRLARQRDQAMAWKLGFDALRRALGQTTYRSFKPIPAPWLRAEFPDFCRWLAGREGVALPPGLDLHSFALQGWRRQGEVLRLSILRHAFRRPLELWLALDLAAFLAGEGYATALSTFCARALTPRNLLLSARR